MKQILINIQNQLAEITELRYIDEDWGQIDYYSPNIPVQWPCCLIDIQSGNFSNLSKDFSKSLKNRQKAEFSVKITLANMKLTNTSYLAPQEQKEQVWAIFELIEKIHQKLHGFSPHENCSKMLRTTFGRTQRDDGVQEYAIIYNFEAHNI